MTGMFASASSFNQTLNDWNVSSVNNTSYMFGRLLLQSPLNDWNVSSVTTSYMFLKASSFNQTLNNWDVSSVTDMSMFMLPPTSTVTLPPGTSPLST